MTALRVLGLLASMVFVIGVLFVLAVGPSGHGLRTSIEHKTTELEAQLQEQTQRVATSVTPKKSIATSPAQPPAPVKRSIARQNEPTKSRIAKPSPQKPVIAKRSMPNSATARASAPNDRRITYKADGQGWKVESGYEGGNIFWEKTKIVNGKRKTVRFVYPPSERRKYDRMIANVDSQF
jgi:hypothetical protein